MKLKDLRRTHPDLDLETLQTHGDLFAGGAQFRRNVARYLPRHDVEPAAVYKVRCASATYLNYCAPVANYFASYLFTSPLVVRGETESGGEPDPFYAAFKEDCDGTGTDLDAFLRARFVEALVAQRAYWRVEFPAPGDAPPADKAAWEAAGLGRARLVAVPAANVTHWKREPDGAFAWVVEHDRRCELADFAAPEETVTESWTRWDADGSATRWEVSYPKSKPPTANDVIPEVDAPHNPTGRIPLVELSLPRELWVLNLLADPQLELFRKRAALSWSIDRVCYAMPVLFTNSKKRPSAMGAGYFLQLGADDRLEFPAPPTAPFATIEANVAALKDEAFRIAHQMAQGVSNNAAAVGRSAGSKQADNAATEIVLQAYGARVREPAEHTHALLAAGRGEAIAWDVGGMNSFTAADAAALAESALVLDPLRIPSATFKREQLTRVALAQVPDADAETKAAIRAEIKAGVTAEDVAARPPPATVAASGDPSAEPAPAQEPNP